MLLRAARLLLIFRCLEFSAFTPAALFSPLSVFDLRCYCAPLFRCLRLPPALAERFIFAIADAARRALLPLRHAPCRYAC